MFKSKDSKKPLMLKFLKAIRTQTKVLIQKCLKLSKEVRTQKSKVTKSNKDSNKSPYSKMFKSKDSKKPLMLKFLKATRTQTKVLID